MIIRSISLEDAEPYLAMLKQLDRETDMMMYEPEERSGTFCEMTRLIQDAESAGSLILVVEDENRLVGFLSAERGFANRIRHSAYIVVGILASHRGKGLGKRLFQELDHWAAKNQIGKLELTVLAHNQAGIRLYTSMGFKIEGTKKKSLFINGQYYDELYMGKIMNP